MKMGTTASPWRYDNGACSALQSSRAAKDLRFRATPRGPSCLIDVPRGLEDKLYQGDLRQRCDAVPAPVDCGLRLGINQLAIPIEAQKRPPGVVPARDQVAARQPQLAQATIIVERERRRTRFDRDAIDVPVLRESNTDETTSSVEVDARPARKRPTGEDVLSRQHGSRKAPVRMEVQRQKQIFTAGAGNAIDIAIACQVERADALVGVEPHQRFAKAGQAIDLLIRAQSHIGEASILATGSRSSWRTAACRRGTRGTAWRR